MRVVAVVLVALLPGCLALPAASSGDGGGDPHDAAAPDAGTVTGTVRTIGDRSAPVATVAVAAGPTADSVTLAGALDVISAGDDLSIAGTTYYLRALDGTTAYLEEPFASMPGWGEVWRAHGSIAEWYDAIPADLVAADLAMTGLLFSDQVLTSTVVLGSKVTDATHHVTLQAAPGRRHTGVEGTGVAIDRRLAPGTCLAVRDDHTRLIGLTFRGCGVNDTDAAIDIDGAGNVVIDSVIVTDYGVAGSSTSGVSIDASVVTVQNSIFADGPRGVDVNSGAARVESSTFFRMTGDGVNADDPGTTATFNCLFVGTGRDGDVAHQSAIAVGSGDGIVASVDALAPDLHLRADAPASLATGSDRSSFFGHDIDHDPRPTGAAWDVGADQRP